MSETTLELKLSAARTRLILDKPFLGALVLRLPLVAANPEWCHTTATDAKSFFYNPDYIDSLSIAQTQFILAHEALHCALSHFARRQHRNKHRWDIACDFAINPMLTADGLLAPPGALLEQSYNDMTAEEIYPYIQENSDEAILDKHIYDSDSESGNNNSRQNVDISTSLTSQSQPKDNKNSEREPSPDSSSGSQDKQSSASQSPSSESKASATDQSSEEFQSGAAEKDGDGNGSVTGAAQPPPLSEQEREDLKVQWQQRMAGAAQQAIQAGKMGAAMRRLVEHLLQPQLPWRSLLTQYMTNIARDDYSYARPNSRRGGPAIFPRLRSEEVDILVVLDTSGSITDNETLEFLTEVNAIKGQLRARIVFQTCDAALSEQGPWVYESWEDFSLPEYLPDGGATDFRPAFAWADSLDRAPQLLVYFTDADGDFPDQAPHFPVIWLVKGKSKVPWGQRVQLN